MAAGTWNQGELEKRVTKIDLENYPTIQFRDTSLISDGIFDIVEFPTRFTAGKNLIKLRANNNNVLVKNSKIHIEILDSNGSPIYYEPLNYLEHDGTRVISIYIYPDKTAPGIGTVYIASRTKIDINTNQQVPFSRDYNDPNYFNLPNVLWSRDIPIAPENSKNNTEIIFTQPYPKATVQERVNRFFTPINLSDVEVARSGSGVVIIKAIPSTAPKRKSIKSLSSNISQRINYEGGATARTPMRSAGKQAIIKPVVKNTSATNQPLEVESAEIVTISTFSRLETTGFALSSSMEGGSITIVNPQVDLLQGNSLIDSNGHLIPSSQTTTDQAAVTSNDLGDPSIQLSGSYTFVIDKILSSTKANVFLSTGFKNEDENTFGAFSFTTIGKDGEYDIKNIKASSNFTCSYVEPFILSSTEQSQSFAEIVLGNIEPATGDVHKIQTLYKPAGQFGDFIDAGYVEVEQVEILEDVASFESIQSIGMIYNRIGYFTSLDDFNAYWETPADSVNKVQLTPSFKSDILIDGIELTPDSTFDASLNQYGYINLKSVYHPKVYANTRYMLTFNAVADDSTHTSTDSNILHPRVDIYISGSNSSIEVDSQYLNRYLTNTNAEIDDITLFGTRIATIEIAQGNTFDADPAFLSFRTLKEENIDVYFVIRRGKWTLSNISLKSDKQTGFSPNFTRINTRIPSEFLETPLTFKFLYYDIHNNKAQAETTVYPVTFYGDNLLIDGTNNLLTGSLFIGNTTGAGIELAGVNSGYIRSIGYNGFKSASRTDQPGGFMIYTGSVLPGSPDNYNGVGLELVQDSSSFFKFDTSDGIDIRAKKFFIGSEGTQFISGSGGNIEISSSLFHLDPQNNSLIIGADATINAGLTVNSLRTPATINGAGSTTNNASSSIDSDGFARFASASIAGFNVVTEEIRSSNNNLRLKATGQITGTNVQFTGGELAGWKLSDKSFDGGAMHINKQGFISASTYWKISSSVNTNDPGGFISSSQFKVSPGGKTTGSQVLFDGGKIGGWNIKPVALSSTGVHLSSSYGLKVFEDVNNEVNVRYLASDDYGILGKVGGNVTFALGANTITGEPNNHIAGWEFDNEKLTGGSMIIRKDGTIESDGFVSNLAGSGFRLTAASGGMLEVENARIRGTLSTAVFEKETVNAVGGQLYVANSTTLTGSAANPGGFYSATATTMSVKNVSGFSVGEIITAKKVSSTGFATEYLFINSASRNDKSSDTDLAGKIYVIRGYVNNRKSSSFGDLVSVAQTYTGSQVIVSTGKLGTGYIRLNANPNDQATPYMQIVERTGSGVYDLSLKAQLGDLSGITDSSFSDGVTGFGLYTGNGYFKGKLEITDPVGDSMLESFGGVSGSSVPSTKLVPDGEISGSQWFQIITTRHQVKNGILMVSSSNNGNWNSELRSKQRFHRSGDHSLVFDVVPRDITGNQVAPRMMIGWGAVPSASTVVHPTATYQNTAHALYFSSNDISAYHGGTSMGSVAANSLEVGAKYRCIITPFDNSSKSARYQVFKYPNLTGSIGDVEFAGQPHTPDDLDVSITCLKNTHVMDICNIQVTAPGQKTTVIDGGSVTTGKIRSTNFGASVGSELDLDAGTIRLGGSNSPKFEVDTSGNVTATGGTIAGWRLSDESFDGGNMHISKLGNITSSTHWRISSSQDKPDPVSFISSSAFKVSADGRITASAGQVGAVTLGTNKMFVGTGTFSASNTPIYMDSIGRFSLKDKLSWNGTNLAINGTITIGAASTTEVDFGAGAAASASVNALIPFKQWATASLAQLRSSGDLNGGTVPDDRGMFTTPSYWTNGPLVQIFDTGPISNGWTTSQTDYSAIPNSDTFTFTSTEAVSGSIRVIANDAENGARLIVNSSSGYVAPQLIMHDDFTELNPHGRSAPVFVNQSGSNGIDIHTGSNWALSANITNFGDTSGGSDTGEKTDAMWEYRIPILSGSNVIKMFSPTGDGGHVRRLSVFKDGTIGQLGIDTAQSASNSAAVQAGAASASAAIGIVDAAAASASAAIGIVDAAAASASAATAQSASNAATVMVGAASSSAALAIFSASSAQTAIDDIVKQVVLSNDSIHISSSGQSPDFGLAKFGTTTEFYDGTSAQNVKLQLNTVGVKSLFDADNYSLMFNQGLQVVSASSQVALFGQDTIVGRVAANKSNVQIKDGKVKLRTNTVTKLELDTTGAISASGFAINAAGALTASNADFDGFAIARSLRQKAVVINQSNMHEYLVQVIRTDESDAEVDAGDVDFVVSTTSRLVLDGSLGGEVISHVIFDLDLSIIDPNSGFVQNGFLICMANGTVPTSTYNSVSIAANGTTSTATIAPNANNAGAFGPIREIVSPPTTGNAKVPVTIEIKDGANVEFYVPIGPAATSSAFGNLQTRIDAIQLAANTFVGVKATGE